MKSISCYKIGNTIFTIAHSKTTIGMRMLHGKVFITDDGDINQMVEVIMGSFSECTTGIPHPTSDEFKEKSKNQKHHPLLMAAKFKTFAALEKKSQQIHIYMDEDKNILEITPYVALKRKVGGSSPLIEQAVELSLDASAEDLGKAILESFEKSEQGNLGIL